VEPIKEIHPLQLCFDKERREIEVLDVVIMDTDTLLIEENPIFNEQVSFGDIIKVRQEEEVYYYIETIQKSELIRHSWLLSKEISESTELVVIKDRINDVKGRTEQVFGGLLVINISLEYENEIVDEINQLIKKFDH
jgi:hypothetical protein